ncbi:MAG: hypothetical protein HY059_13725 [Proteobacteria bacterium]|nr:hypothetical protein [Pseudomonadota bacterium]
MEALAAFERLRKSGTPGAEANYLAGALLLLLGLPEKAEPLLNDARKSGYRAPKGQSPVRRLLRRVELVRKYRPKRMTLRTLPRGARVELYARATPWTRPVLAALPKFMRVGRRIYGKHLPPVRLYLFSDRTAYRHFFRALFDQSYHTPWQDGTGGLNVVLFSETENRPAGELETMGNVLHEFGHAWASTYVMTKHDVFFHDDTTTPPYLDEGLADYITHLWDPEYLGLRKGYVESDIDRLKCTPPPFAQLDSFKRFYRGRKTGLCYSLSAMLMDRMLGRGPSRARRIPGILDALIRSGTGHAALRKVVGRDPRREYARLCREFWS